MKRIGSRPKRSGDDRFPIEIAFSRCRGADADGATGLAGGQTVTIGFENRQHRFQADRVASADNA